MLIYEGTIRTELTLIYERTKCELGSEKIHTPTEKIENTLPSPNIL